MKKVLATGTKYIFGAFAFAILGLLMSLTYQALGRIFPDSPVNQIWGLVLFDIAAIVWALAFVFACQTTGQYAAALIGFLTGFAGTLIMVGAEVMLGQTLTPANSAEIGRWLIYGFIGATALHATLLYLHHYNGQEIRQKVDVGIARGEVTTEAIRQAQGIIEQEKHSLARTIADGIVSDVKRELGLYPVEGTPFEPKQLTVHAPTPSQDQAELVPDEIKRMYAPGTTFIDGTTTPTDLNDPFWSEHPHHMGERYGTKPQEAGEQPSPFRGSPSE